MSETALILHKKAYLFFIRTKGVRHNYIPKKKKKKLIKNCYDTGGEKSCWKISKSGIPQLVYFVTKVASGNESNNTAEGLCPIAGSYRTDFHYTHQLTENYNPTTTFLSSFGATHKILWSQLGSQPCFHLFHTCILVLTNLITFLMI